MTRPGHILSEMLDVLADWGGPIDEAVLHTQISDRVLPKVELAEFRHALKCADTEGWIAQLDSKRRGTLWSITSKGEAERLK